MAVNVAATVDHGFHSDGETSSEGHFDSRSHRFLRWTIFVAVVFVVGRLHLWNIEAVQSLWLYRMLSFVPWLSAEVASVRWGLPFDSYAPVLGYVYFGMLLYLPIFKPVNRTSHVALMLLAAVGVHAAITGASLAAYGICIPVQ